MSNKLITTKNFLDTGLEKVKNCYKLSKQATIDNYEKTLESQKEIILSLILESVNEHYSKLENVRNGIKDPLIQRFAMEALSEINICKLIVFPEKTQILPETINLAISYGLTIVKAPEKERIRARLTFCDRVYQLVGTINIAESEEKKGDARNA